MKKLIIILISLYLTISCSQHDTVQLCNSDNSNCVTFITRDSIRFIIHGSRTDIPTTNYASLNVGKIDPLADAIYICWYENNKWEITIDKAKLIDYRLDSTIHKIFTILPTDKRGIPTAINFAEDNCAVFDYELMRLIGHDIKSRAILK